MRKLTPLYLLPLFASTASAQEAPNTPVYELEGFTVSAGPTARPLSDFANPVSSLDADAIAGSSAGNLGALLDGQPGVSASSFGAGASRPIIRGFDGPRVRILESGLGTQDVSETSPDHAVTIEPLLTQRVEVLRGPSTLLYGSQAIGGVVNVVGRDLPRERPEHQLSGAFETRYDTVSDGETYLGRFSFSEGPLVLSLQGLKREFEDYHIPGKAEIHADHEEHGHDDDHGHDEHDHGHDHDHEYDEHGHMHDDHGHEHDDHGHEHSEGDRLASSFVENEFYSVGATWFFTDETYFGFSVSGYDSSYGVPGHAHAHGGHDHDDHGHDDHGHGDHEHSDHEHSDHEHGDHEHGDHEHGDHEHGGHDHGGHSHEGGVAIEMERTRFDAELAVAEPMPGIEALRVRFGYTDYEHSEIEEGSAAATFLREGWELRAEAANEAWAIFDEGVIGLQISDTDFEAFGEEIESDEGFAFGPPSKTKSQAAFVSQHIHAGDWHYEAGGRLERQTIDAQGVDDYSGVATSLSASALWAFAPSHSIGFALQHTQRHPNATELYANGPHLATSQFEVGDEDLGMEKGYGADLSYRYRGDRWDATVSVFYTIFDNYIFAQNSGMEEDGLPLFNYTEAEATFYGAELELDYLIYRSGDLAVTAGLLADYVSAENTDDNTDLPRIPPFRLGGTTELTYGNWNAGLLLRHSFDQNNTAPEETETDSYTELELELGYVFELNNRANLTLFLRGNNLLDEEIRHHTSAIKDVAPLPGRNVTLGARLAF